MVEFPYLDKVFFGSIVISISLRQLLFFFLQSSVLACTKVSFGILPLIQPKSASCPFFEKVKITQNSWLNSSIFSIFWTIFPKSTKRDLLLGNFFFFPL